MLRIMVKLMRALIKILTASDDMFFSRNISYIDTRVMFEHEHLDDTRAFESDTDKSVSDHIRLLVGFLTFIVIFVAAIPLSLRKMGYDTLLEAYLPNVDMIATVLNFVGGPWDLWKGLYPDSPEDMTQFYSEVIINFLALCGLTFLVARETKLSGSIAKGWSIAFVMILVTYLIPGKYIYLWLKDLYKTTPSPYASVLAGGVMISGFVLAEKYLIEFSRKYLSNIANFIMKL